MGNQQVKHPRFTCVSVGHRSSGSKQSPGTLRTAANGMPENLEAVKDCERTMGLMLLRPTYLPTLLLYYLTPPHPTPPHSNPPYLTQPHPQLTHSTLPYPTMAMYLPFLCN